MNTKQGLIGVIVPVYKVEKYIAECIESILAQTYTNFRLILVDDGTPDNAGKICDEYAEKDSRITVIHQKNAGATQARARGVDEAADCEFITFVDGDDTITPAALQELHILMKKNTDIVIVDYHKLFAFCKHIPIQDYRKYIFAELRVSPVPWGKLFRRTLFNQFTFSINREIVIAEDVIMNLRLGFNPEKDVNICNSPIYNYREYPESTFHSHVRTPENEQKIYENKVLSLPICIDKETKKEYIYDSISGRLIRFREFWGYKYRVKGMKKNIFYQMLKKDIVELKYKQDFLDNIIFNSTSPIVRYIAINAKKIRNKFFFKK